tara:strand:+ start:335 stop:475 length:141 start_codon:yes stop_codon:yes gene_type:complete
MLSFESAGSIRELMKSGVLFMSFPLSLLAVEDEQDLSPQNKHVKKS